MDFDPLEYLGWREVLIAIIAMLVLYVIVAFLRISRLRQRQAVSGVSDQALKSAIAAYAAEQQPVAPGDVSDMPWAASSDAKAIFSEEALPAQDSDEELAAPRHEALIGELEQLRLEVGSLRAEVLRLREEQKRELTEIREVQSISPIYSDAMQMAMQGHDAAILSQHCGISRAEAELVVALVRNRDH